ncbi:MAG: hypothetical protein OXC30_05270 [Alphaproteobacteria bacterium]|nr:hypothetical protein [Alphaproteobacteria bacterium]
MAILFALAINVMAAVDPCDLDRSDGQDRCVSERGTKDFGFSYNDLPVQVPVEGAEDDFDAVMTRAVDTLAKMKTLTVMHESSQVAQALKDYLAESKEKFAMFQKLKDLEELQNEYETAHTYLQKYTRGAAVDPKIEPIIQKLCEHAKTAEDEENHKALKSFLTVGLSLKGVATLCAYVQTVKEEKQQAWSHCLTTAKRSRCLLNDADHLLQANHESMRNILGL